MTFEKRENKNVVYVDHHIRARSVLVIDDSVKPPVNLGVMPLYEALDISRGKGLNLLQMGPGNPPTCKILDYGKFKYDESKRLKAAAKKQREMQIEKKEIAFKPDTALNDLRIKAKKAAELLAEKAEVKVNIKCVGREVNHVHMVEQALDTFMSFLPGVIARPVSAPPPGSSAIRFSFQLEVQ